MAKKAKAAANDDMEDLIGDTTDKKSKKVKAKAKAKSAKPAAKVVAKAKAKKPNGARVSRGKGKYFFSKADRAALASKVVKSIKSEMRVDDIAKKFDVENWQARLAGNLAVRQKQLKKKYSGSKGGRVIYLPK